MTYAPDDLLAVRRYVLGATGLSGDAVGIVAGPADAAGGGYHCGNDALASIGQLNSDYSKRQSPRDRPGTDAASALDIGDGWKLGRPRFYRFNADLVRACQAGDPRARDIREVIYTLDGVMVHRWDRLGYSTTGDSSHLFHTHTSFFRDSEGRRASPDNALGLFAELIEGRPPAATVRESDMWGKIKDQGTVWRSAGRIRVPAPDGPTATAWQKLLPGQEVADEGALTALLGPTVDPDVASLRSQLADLASRSAVQPAPVSPASLVAALSDPAVRALLVEAGRLGSNLAEDS